MIPRSLVALGASALLIATLVPAGVDAQGPTRPNLTLPKALEQDRLAKPVRDKHVAERAKIALSLDAAKGPVRVFVRLSSTPAAEFATRGPAAVMAQVRINRSQQARVIAVARTLDKSVKILGRTDRASNVVAMRIAANSIRTLAKDPRVVSINPVVDYQLALSETVPYIGGTTVQKAGFKGAGIKVGVVDSGIDYTHKEFGGPGTVPAYEAAYGTGPTDPKNTTTDGLFPTARVVGGWDFVGESWPGTDPDNPEAENPDPDPIDFEGHGTHVADIIGGTKGVAPKVRLYALKVCSAVATSCSGVGLLQAVDWAVDPNQNGSTKDHLDILNMSLGSDYSSPYIDDLSFAVDQATRVGVMTVAAAGNGGDKPYIAGTPAGARTALSVAQTNVPSALAFPLVVNSPPAIAGSYTNTATLDFAPLGSGFSGDIAYVGRGCPAGSVDGQPGADTYLDDPTGKVALIDRGACNVSLKVDRAAKAGATAVLIGLVAPGDAASFSIGGGDPFVPSLVITQDLSDGDQGQPAGPRVRVRCGQHPAQGRHGRLVLARPGDRHQRHQARDRRARRLGLGGRRQRRRVRGLRRHVRCHADGHRRGGPAVRRLPASDRGEIKSLLMNTAETKIYNNLANTPGYLAPITRIGGGEVRVDRALKSPAAAWDRSAHSGDLSFGFVDVTKQLTTLSKWVRIRNYSNRTLRYAITPKFRYANDRTNGAVKITAPTRVTLAPHSQRTFKVTVRINGPKLRDWALDSGAAALDARALDQLEYDGYLTFNNLATHKDDQKKLHMAWHILPRLSGKVTAASTSLVADGTISGGAVRWRRVGRHHADQQRRRDGHGRPVLAGRHEPRPAAGGPRVEPAGDRPPQRRRPDLPGPGIDGLRRGRLVRLRHRRQRLGARDDRVLPGPDRGVPRHEGRHRSRLPGVQRAALGTGHHR